MNRYGAWTLRVCAAAILFPLAALSQQPNLRAQCEKAEDGDTGFRKAIAACTALIKTPGASKDDLVLAYHWRGIRSGSGNNQDQAIADFNAALALDPANKEVLLSRGDAYRGKSDRGRAFEDYQRVINIDPTFAIAFLKRAEVYLEAGQFDNAIADYNRALILDLPWREEGFSARAAAHLKMGNLDAAIADYSEAIRLTDKASQDILLRDRAAVYLLNAQYDDAIDDYSQAIKVYRSIKELPKGYGDLLLGRGNAYRGKGQYDLALKDYEAALKSSAEAGEVALDRARTLFAKGDWRGAISSYKLAADTHGLHSTESSLLGKGNAHLALKEYDQAIAEYTRVIEGFRHQHALALHKRADAYEGKGDAASAKADRAKAGRLNPYLVPALSQAKGQLHDDAVVIFMNAVRLRSADPEMRLGLGLAYRDLWSGNSDYYGNLNFSSAVAGFSQAIRLDPKSAEAYGYRGELYRANGNYENAATDLTAALRLDPDLRAALRARGQLYSDKRDFDRAITDYNRLVALDPKDTDALMKRAVAYAGKRELDLTIADITQIIKLEPKDSNAFYQRAEAYLLKKDYRSAIADYSTAIALNPMLTGATLASLKKEQVSFGRSFSMMFYQRGSAYLETGDYHRAIVDFTDAIEVERDPLAIFFEGRAAAQQKLGMTEKAIVDYQSAASIFENAGNLRDPFRIFNLILEIKPGLPEGLNGRCWVRALANEQLKEALDDCNASLNANRSAYTLDSRALVYYRLGDFKAALADYDEAIKLNAKTAAFWYGRSAVRAKLGDARGARGDIETATKLDANIGVYFSKFGL